VSSRIPRGPKSLSLPHFDKKPAPSTQATRGMTSCAGVLARAMRLAKAATAWWSDDGPTATRRPWLPAVEAVRRADVGLDAAVFPQHHGAMVEAFGVRGPPTKLERDSAARADRVIPRGRGPPFTVSCEIRNHIHPYGLDRGQIANHG